MSLNGLDTAAVVEAYQSALADAGGWFLLHYVARDEVALLERGTGGVPEIRNAIDSYEESSPLYGFLQYRRRKVIIRYMPEGLSRLIQARSNVQFTSVTDKFTPNDTVLPLSKASDLTESALSSACLLHTASTSITSSSSSLRRRRLMEITEDAEENGTRDEAPSPVQHSQKPPQIPLQKPPQKPPHLVNHQRSESIQSEATIVPPPEETPPELQTMSPDSDRAVIEPMPPPSRASSRAPSRRSPSEPRGSPSASFSAAQSPKSSDLERSSSRYRNILDEFPRPSEEARMSTQSARPSLRDLERAAGFTPKVKLGPRPSVDSSGRPRTAGSTRNADQRPVASLPTNMRSSSVRKPNPDAPRPRSQGSTFAVKPTSRVPPVPPLLVPPPSIPISRPQLSPGAKSLGALSTSSGLSPEKERLMKALQQRKKNMAKRAEETKKKKQVSEGKKPEKEVQELEDNKENLAEAPQLEFERPGTETVQQDQPDTPLGAAPSAPEPVPEPVPESMLKSTPEPTVEPPAEPVEATPEPVLEAVEPTPEAAVEAISESISQDQPAVISEVVQASEPLESSQPEPTADAPVAKPEVGPVSPISPTLHTTVSGRVDTPVETVQAETSQAPPEAETRLEDSAIPDRAPPSNVDVPLQNESSEAPEPESDPQSHFQFSIQPVTDSLDTPEPAPVESDPIPATPSITPPQSADNDLPVAPISVSVEPSPVDKVAPEYSPAQKAEPLPLDQRRRVHLEPIQVPTPEYSDDDNLLSDDSFMEELTSATVQEARPISVKSPNGGDHGWRSSRAVSSPYSAASPSAMHALAVGRSVSSSYSENGPPTPVLMAKKINVSSGISSRIKALEKFSSREGTPMGSSPTVSGPSAASSFENLRKRTSISLPSGNETTPPSTMHSAHPEGFSRAPSVSRHDPRRMSVDAMRRANSVSVTAHIVRDSDISPGSSGVEPSESDVLGLHASPLTVEHEMADEPPSSQASIAETSRPEDRSMSMSSTGSGRPSSSRPGSRLSLSSRPRTSEPAQSASPTSEDKKASRASRLMRRMSSITSTSRRSIIGALSSPVKEEEYTPTFGNSSSEAPTSTTSRTSEPIDIGEVNVQFPDTLLWKRRVMRIDENGFVVLTPGTNDAATRNMTKRYHLTEFRKPCLPEEDMQELPNSILLDFLDGNTLQCACESRQGQASTLQTLIDAHSAHQQ
ncbi:hypothetical protein N7522_009119 [Penicillium canescens]|uniref:GPI-anchored cell surface glycoprotein n=1 Tax=Penicillium canescens TaxID=5083 RepID=A0AAD6ID91_PENCN|nr:uncharacterized protein N7446_001922 [Penicillium canescens]KAJ5997459.1 hypothetical protein N7522_009119 [Penicillium canescens]KAJ6043726.1 hypothetical protein N7460_005081 [Penicillium canescens]KAJ6055198.1 hypothetical protein N7444_004296 [Penicillium canescens]KAJ6074145.1 hypothetical protein N7446_001922 [Penicillium canescens]